MTEREMMEEAMETVEREYSVVGVTERFNDSLQVMEKYLPGDTYPTQNIGGKYPEKYCCIGRIYSGHPGGVTLLRMWTLFCDNLNPFQLGFQAPGPLSPK